MYLGIGDLLDEAARDPKCKAVAFTECNNCSQARLCATPGTGDYYCSGNDLSNFIKGAQGGDIPTMAAQSGKLLQKYIDSYIDFPKPLIVGINGHAIGISVTVLGLCDLVFSSDQATFHTPFSSLGQAPEGCSSLLFRRLMGSKANRMLMLNYKMKAKEAYECGLVSELLPHENFASEFAQRLQQIAQLPAESLRCAKRPAQELEKELLHKINAKECEQLVERWQSDDCMAALAKFFQRSKSNL
ncbi:ECI2 [Cordylochernes scorpioides]|uniref:ECI2 n=1 Tax=Cordylochernes scorpioides TaxID=51811 RepID=A0ABY6L472_9ARAC|nr:ECI2 [Cordylochernes scorpioides]